MKCTTQPRSTRCLWMLQICWLKWSFCWSTFGAIRGSGQATCMSMSGNMVTWEERAISTKVMSSLQFVPGSYWHWGYQGANANYKLNHMSFVFLNTVGASGAVLSLLIGNVRIDPKVSSTNEKSSEYHINLKHSWWDLTTTLMPSFLL